MARKEGAPLELVEVTDDPGAQDREEGSPKVRGLIAWAIQSRIKALGDAAKNAAKLGGYETERSHYEADASVLATVVMPQFSDGQLPLLPTSPEDVRSAIAFQVAKVLRKKKVRGPNLDDQEGEDDLAFEEACDAIAAAIFDSMKVMHDGGYATARNELANDPVLWWPAAVDAFRPLE